MQYSKFIPIITGSLFAYCLVMAFKVDYSSVLDTTLYVTAITVSGGIFGTANLFYYKKALGENLVKVRISLYKETMKQRLEYNAKMLALKDEYKVDQIDIDEIENDFILKDKTNGIIDSADNDLYETGEIQQQNY